MEPVSFRSPGADLGVNDFNAFVEAQQRRIQELERINVDLERRLEQQARERMKIERESSENKRMWEAQHAEIGRERDEWRKRYEKELVHVHKLRENNRRLERELHGILQKKYDFMQASKQSGKGAVGGGGGPGAGAGPGAPGGGGGGGGWERGAAGAPGSERHMVRSGTLGGSGRGETVPLNPKDLTPETVREKRVIQSLSDFFGF